jgi:AraC-like DNA-binding protein
MNMQGIAVSLILFCRLSEREGTSLQTAKPVVLGTKLLAHHYSKDRTSFRMPEETYEGWAIIASEKGAYRYAVGEEKGEAKVGEAVLCPPGIALHREMLETMDFHYLQFRLRALSSEGPIEFPHFGKLVFRDTARFLSTLAALRESRDNVSLRYSEHLITDILYQYIGERAVRRKEMRPRNEAIVEAVRLLNEQACQPISMQSLAELVGLSQSQFTRKFQKEMGLSPVKYLTGIRLNKVRQMLAETDESLEAIAEWSGYQNSFYLSRVFTKEMGMTPSRYRSTHRV